MKSPGRLGWDSGRAGKRCGRLQEAQDVIGSHFVFADKDFLNDFWLITLNAFFFFRSFSKSLAELLRSLRGICSKVAGVLCSRLLGWDG